MGDIGLPLRALDLTEAQREQVKQVMQSHQTEFKEIGDRLRTARQALDAAVTADTLDEQAVRARATEAAAIEGDAAVLRAKVHQEVYGLLTSEQQTRAKELKAQAEQRMQERAAQVRERKPRPQP
jgi:protein CpxP